MYQSIKPALMLLYAMLWPSNQTSNFQMATLNKKILGTPNGQIGSIVVQKWKTKTVGRSMPAGYFDANSAAQQPPRKNIKILDSFVKALNPFIKTYFFPISKGQPWQNPFISMNSNIYNGTNQGTIVNSVQLLQFTKSNFAGTWPIEIQNIPGQGLEWYNNPALWEPAFDDYVIDVCAYRVKNNQVFFEARFDNVSKLGHASGLIPWVGNPFITVVAYKPGQRQSTKTQSVTVGFINPYE